MLSVGRVMEFSAMTNATAPKSSERVSSEKTSTLAADNTDKFEQSEATFTQAYTKATVTDNRSNNLDSGTKPDGADVVRNARELREAEREAQERVNEDGAVPQAPGIMKTKEDIMLDFVRQTLSQQVEDSRKSAAQRELDEILGSMGEIEEHEEDYWTAEKTAYRILRFAEQLAEGDVSEFDTLRAAFEAGFRATEKSSGGRLALPDVSFRTYEIVQNGFDFVSTNPQ